MVSEALHVITHLANGMCVDGVGDTKVRSLYLVNGLIAESIEPTARIYANYDVRGKVLMAGGIDLHTHIGGGKVNIARLLLPELVLPKIESFDSHGIRQLSAPVPTTWETGLRYLEMGYTTCMEPAVLPANARQAHREMADIPWLDTGGYLLLGNDRMLLRWIAEGVSQEQINQYVAWMLKAHQCCGVKVVNAGGIDAFKFNQRHLDVDESHPVFPVTPRDILRALAQAVDELRLAHPLHVHCSNLGVPGNIASTLKTLQAVEGRRIHLTHAQFHCYGTGGPHGFSSEAYQLAEYVNWNSHVTIDIGQVLFGQTVTISGDTMHQFANRNLARPRKVIFQDLECQAGCGVVPFRYKQDQYVHGLQWTIGLELCLRILDPTRVFLTTDHPNGGPFTAYPHLLRLLTSYDFRMSIFERLHPDVQSSSSLPSLKREYTLEEIAQMTRRGPAKILGLQDRGTLESGKVADVVVYDPSEKLDTMFSSPTMVFRHGELVYRDGQALKGSCKTTIVANPSVETSMNARLNREWPEQYGYNTDMVRIVDEELLSGGHRLKAATPLSSS